MDKRLATAVLLLLLVVLQAQLWLGRGSVPKVAELQRQVDAQQVKNVQARQANEQLAAEVRDLREGLEMVEEKARSELGMVRQGEIFVQVTPRGAVLPPVLPASAARPATATVAPASARKP